MPMYVVADGGHVRRLTCAGHLADVADTVFGGQANVHLYRLDLSELEATEQDIDAMMADGVPVQAGPPPRESR